MNKLLIGLAAVLLLSGVAFAAQPLTNAQMDAVTAGQVDNVTAGFSARSTAKAEVVGGVGSAAALALAEVAPLGDTSGNPTTTTGGETTHNIVKSVSAVQSVTNLPSFEPCCASPP